MTRPLLIDADGTTLQELAGLPPANIMRGRPKTAGNKRANSIARMSHLKGYLDEPLSLRDVLAQSRPDTAHQSVGRKAPVAANFVDVESMQQ